MDLIVDGWDQIVCGICSASFVSFGISLVLVFPFWKFLSASAEFSASLIVLVTTLYVSAACVYVSQWFLFDYWLLALLMMNRKGSFSLFCYALFFFPS